MKTKPGLLLSALALMGSATAHANFTCSGDVTYLGLGTSGVVILGIGGYGPWNICSTSTAMGSFTPEGCRSWYAMMLASQKVDEPVIAYFQSSASGGNDANCTGMPEWAAPTSPIYHLAVL